MRQSWMAVMALGWGAFGLNLGCAAAPLHVAALDQVEQIRNTDAAKEAAAEAPEIAARADRERALAESAHAEGDNVEATLHADRAIAAYSHALAVTRLARATLERADAEKSLGDAVVAEQTLGAERAKWDGEAGELEKQVEVARDRWLPAASGPAPERENARRTAAASMSVEARLLCGAARLAFTGADGLAPAEADVAALERSAKDPAGTAIDDAARARARCLDVLTRARRKAGTENGTADSLLSELAASNSWDPTRDERGVVVTLRDLFGGAKLTDAATAKLKELGRVAASHPTFAVQVVVHDAMPSHAKDEEDPRRAEAAVLALVAGGATASRIGTELAGARAPVADPNDPRVRRRNERLEVVFVN